ncbi:hypothetical protein [Geodermatophilus marinus]|uniref:hypothetical protein n=1 Tax=Geodermatophilus sp. LHW52908 TaxID=2303986 RepID=UPI000E3D0607|nr:hypothetical protein [Geodermatophilus sp. LHW52908]RFU22903.1 hypothetical protein D0Z06_03320 [Geodermatophilus sp. LHW52908]
MPARRTARLAAATGVAALALGLGACSEDDLGAQDPDLEPGTPDVRGEDDLTDPYTGDYDAAWAEDYEAYLDQEVTLSARVGEVLTPQVFTIEPPPEGGEAPELLVVTEQDVTDLSPGIAVVVAATPREEFDLPAAEEQTGTDLPDADLGSWDGEAWLEAAAVETSPSDDG